MNGVRFTLTVTREQAPIAWPKFHEWRVQDDEPWLIFHRTSRGYLLRFPNLADFGISSSGRSVRSFPAPHTSIATLRHLQINQVLPLALSRQGQLMFHAGVVAVGEDAIVFLGASGRGKSTLTASFATAGHRFLSDDSVRLDGSTGQCLAFPGHPSIRLWDDSHDELVRTRVPLADPVQYTSKIRVLAGHSIKHCVKPCSLRRVYVLGNGDVRKTTFKPISPAEALIELVKHSFLLDIQHRDLLAAHFDELARIARMPIHFHLDFPRRYADLDHVRQAIIEHATRESLPS